MQTAPYGSWPSPVTTDLITGATVGLVGGMVDGDDIWWVESHASQRGRASLWRQTPDGTRTEVTPELNVRSAVNEYGGGAYAVRDGVAVVSTFPAHVVMVVEEGRPPRAITPEGPLRFGGFAFLPGGREVVCVREDHTDSDIDCVTTLVRLDLDGDNAEGGEVVASGADFYGQPTVADDGRIAWAEWDHPNMPWDSTRIVVRGTDGSTQQVAGGPGVSVVYPAWQGGTLLLCSDETGFWNLYRWDGSKSRPLAPMPYDICGPAWVLRGAPYAVVDEERVGLSWWVDGLPRVGLLTGDRLEEWPLDVTTATLGGHGTRTLAALEYADRPEELAVLDWDARTVETVRRSSETRLDTDLVSRAEDLTWESPDGPVHAWYYPPRNPGWAAPEGELPPVLVRSHGGPTAFSGADLSLSDQFWTSRGIAVVDVNYSGSTAYGRAYRERLQGTWGISDVRDCADAVRVLVERGLADPARVAITGGSAGGYTTLQALVTTDVFSAGMSSYGIGDLETMTTDTHKFESRYLDGLVGPYPERRDLYLERSPIHHLDGLSSPMLLQQGTEDKVVPPQQAETMAAAVRAKGLPVALVMYEGEGHGFRRADSITRSYDSMLSFLGQVFGFTPAGDVPVLEVENLPAR